MVKSDYSCLLMELPLFKKFTREDLQILLHDSCVKISSYDKDKVIFMEEDTCEHLSIILDGNVEIQKIDLSGKLLTVASLKKGDAFGENLLFGDKNLYPMTVVSKSKSIIIHIPKNIVALLCQKNSDFLYGFLKTLSNKAVALSSKIKQVTLKTIRQKICEFLYKKHCYSKEKKIVLNMSKKQWADKLGVQRPSLSRELMKLKDEGIITYEKDYITILNLDKLEDNV